MSQRAIIPKFANIVPALVDTQTTKSEGPLAWADTVESELTDSPETA